MVTHFLPIHHIECDFSDFEKAMFQGLPCQFELIFGFLNIEKWELVQVENSMFQWLIWLFQLIFDIWTSLKWC